MAPEALGRPEGKWHAAPETYEYFGKHKESLTAKYDAWTETFAAWKEVCLHTEVSAVHMHARTLPAHARTPAPPDQRRTLQTGGNSFQPRSPRR